MRSRWLVAVLLIALVSACAGPGATSTGDSAMDDQLLAAAASGDVPALTAALDGGANVDARDATGPEAVVLNETAARRLFTGIEQACGIVVVF
jgi:hypothetical protein